MDMYYGWHEIQWWTPNRENGTDEFTFFSENGKNGGHVWIILGSNPTSTPISFCLSVPSPHAALELTRMVFLHSHLILPETCNSELTVSYKDKKFKAVDEYKASVKA